MSSFRNDLFKGKVILTTGGGTGIGFACTKAVMAHGANAVIIGRRKDVLEKAAQQLEKETGNKCLAVQGDVRSAESLRAAVKATINKFGRLDMVLAGAAGNFLSPIDGLSENAFATVMAIDTNGTYNTIKATIDELKKTKGTVLAISALLHYRGTMLQAHVSAAKAAIDALFRVAAVEYGPHGVRFNVVAPGGVDDTEGIRRLVTKEALQAATRSIPLGRFSKTDDISDAVIFLYSPAAKHITGIALAVDGGENHTSSQAGLINYPKDMLDTKGFRERIAAKL